MRRCRVSGLRPIAGPFVAAAPAGARVRARLRVSPQDEAVLWAAGRYLGSLAGRDLAARCAEGRLDARGRAGSRARRKKALTAQSSSRWAGAITRTSEDQVRLAGRNLRAERNTLQARVRRIQARLPVRADGKAGRVRGYATPAERHAKAIRLQVLQARLARVDRRLEAGTVSVVRGGKGAAAQAGQSRRRGPDRGAVTGGAGVGPPVPDRRRGERQGVGQRDDPLEPRPGLAGDKTACPAGSPSEPAARPVPPVVPRCLRLPGR